MSLSHIIKKTIKTNDDKMLTFKEYSDLLCEDPGKYLRNIFCVISDMVKDVVGEGHNDYADDPENIGYETFDTSKLLQNADTPFFCDALLANRLIDYMHEMRSEVQNRALVFEGPTGSGKSTMLTNILESLEEYVASDAGAMYEVAWEIGGNTINCPSHDHPLTVIPSKYRKSILEELYCPSSKDFAWIFKAECCPTCTKIYNKLIDKGGIDAVMDALRVKRYKFNRRLGEGISVFNPGDRMDISRCEMNPIAGDKLNEALDSDDMEYVHSTLARTNNGVFALSDIKDNNIHRMNYLHGVISEGKQKVRQYEEDSNSLFIATSNPEDRKNFKVDSFKDRIKFMPVPYILDPEIEADVYKHFLPEEDIAKFDPHVLKIFAAAVIATRMSDESDIDFSELASTMDYDFIDKDGKILRMAVYGGQIPSWLKENDKKKFTKEVRTKIIEEAEKDGLSGISGRESIRLLKRLVNNAKGRISIDEMLGLIGETMMAKFEGAENVLDCEYVIYMDTITDEVGEAIFEYSMSDIDEATKDYLAAVTHDIGDVFVNAWTGNRIKVTEDFLKDYETRTGVYRGAATKKMISSVIPVDIAVNGMNIEDTMYFKKLVTLYKENARESVIDKFKNNNNFREAVKCYTTDTKSFESYDDSIKKNVERIVGKMISMFGYTKEAAARIVLAAIDWEDD